MTTTAVILAAGRGRRMGSDLPKVLHELDGRPLVQYSIDRARAAGVDEIVLVTGYRRELVEEALADQGVRFAVQTEQRGTGHAVLSARDHLADLEGEVVVLYGDMPLLGAETIRSLIDTRRDTMAAAVALTIVTENPPDFGRIIRDERNRVQRVVEVKDANEEELSIKEVNVGAYCFDGPSLLPALDQLRSDNAQGEFYLTDVIGILAAEGRRVETVTAGSLEETLGINDLTHLSFASKLADIRHAESLYDLIDAVALAARQGRGEG